MDNSIDAVDAPSDTYQEEDSTPDRHKALCEAVELRPETERLTNCSLAKTVAITRTASIPPETEPLQASGLATSSSRPVRDEGPDESEEEDDSIVLFASRGEERSKGGRNMETAGESDLAPSGVVYSR